MEHKIIAIDVSYDTDNGLSKESGELLKELQLELFKNGYRWIKDGKKVQTFYAHRNYLVLIDKDMYTMTSEAMKYLEKNNHVHFAGTVVSYFRYLKLKKLKIL